MLAKANHQLLYHQYLIISTWYFMLARLTDIRNSLHVFHGVSWKWILDFCNFLKHNSSDSITQLIIVQASSGSVSAAVRQV